MTSYIQGAGQLISRGLSTVRDAFYTGLDMAKRHPLIAAATAVAAGALVYYTVPGVAECFAAPVIECLPRPPLCHTPEQETFLGFESLGRMFYGAAQTTCIEQPPVCIAADATLCQSAVATVKSLTPYAATLGLAVGVAKAGEAMSSRVIGKKEANADEDYGTRATQQQDELEDDDKTQQPITVRNDTNQTNAASEYDHPVNMAPLADEDFDIQDGDSKETVRSRVDAIASYEPIPVVESEVETEFNETLDAMQRGDFGVLCQQIIAKRPVFSENEVIHIHLLQKLQASNSYEEFIEYASGWIKETSLRRFFTEAVYNAAKESDASQLTLADFAQFDGGELVRAAHEIDERSLDEEGFAQLGIEGLLKTAQERDDSQENPSKEAMQMVFKAYFSDASNPFRSLYRLSRWERQIPAHKYDGVAQMLNERSDVGQEVIQAAAKLSALDLCRAISQIDWDSRNHHYYLDRRPLHLLGIAKSPAFSTLDADLRDDFFGKAAFYGHMHVVRTILRSPVGNEVSGHQLGPAFFHSCVHLDPQVASMILNHPNAKDMADHNIKSAFRHLAQTQGNENLRMRNPEAQVAILKMIEKHPLYLNISVPERRKLLADTINWFQPEGARHPAVFGQLTKMLTALPMATIREQLFGF